MEKLTELSELLKELLHLAPSSCLSSPRRDYWASNRELACYENRENWQELVYVFNYA